MKDAFRILMILFCVSCICVAWGRAHTSFLQANEAQPISPQISVGPNMLVSHEGDIPHVELLLAANGRDPDNFLGAAIVPTTREGDWACKAYVTKDDGATWDDVVFPEQHKTGGADPQVAFGLHGTAYFATLTTLQDEKGRPKDDVAFYRSEDGGETWRKPAYLGSNYDHEVVAVDLTSGKYAGRIYVSVMYFSSVGGTLVYHLGVLRSDDDGRSFVGPVEAAKGSGSTGVNTASNILVLRDGTLVVPYLDFDSNSVQSKDRTFDNYWVVTSSDGGLTFSSPQKVATNELSRSNQGVALETFGTAAVDNQSNVFPDRLYMAWTAHRSGKYRIEFSSSSDRGNTWTKPKFVDDVPAASASQYQPVLTVNKQGIVGITWFDTRASKDGSLYDEYFSASIDGGATFLAPVRVSSESSFPLGAGNLRLIPTGWLAKNELRVTFLNAANRWGAGGDYMGLTADSNGVFRPFWADSRTGTFQVMTSLVHVDLPEKSHAHEAQESEVAEESSESRRKSETRPEPESKVEASVSDRIELVFDPTSYDASTQTAQIPIHLKNVSQATIYGPISVQVKSFGSGTGNVWKENAPEILNANNGKKRDGAIFDYSHAIGSNSRLDSHALSAAVVWKMKLADPLHIPDMHLQVTGFLAARK